MRENKRYFHLHSLASMILYPFATQYNSMGDTEQTSFVRRRLETLAVDTYFMNKANDCLMIALCLWLKQ